MRSIHIDLSNFRQTELLMTKYYGFNRYMLHHEVEALYQIHNYKLDNFAEDKDLSPYKRESSLMYEYFGATAFDIERYTPKKKDEYISYQDVMILPTPESFGKIKEAFEMMDIHIYLSLIHI